MFRAVSLCPSSEVQHCTHSNTYRFCLLLGSGIRMFHPDPSSSSQQNLYDIYPLLCVQCWTPGDGQRYCAKHVEFYSKNKFEKLVGLVGFIIRILHDTRPSKCQNPTRLLSYLVKDRDVFKYKLFIIINSNNKRTDI